MRVLEFIGRRIALLVLSLLFAAIILVLRYAGDAGDWADSAAFRSMPYLVILAALVLGACFHQSRVSFLSLLLIVLMYLVSYSGFMMPDDGRLYAVIFLTSVYLPVLAVVFYFMKEQGIFSAYGYLKMAIILSAIIALLLVPKIPSLTAVFCSAGRPGLCAPVAGWLEIPWIGLIVLLVSIPLLLIPRVHESPSTGILTGLSVMFVFMGMNFRSSLWPAQASHTAFVLFNTGSGVVMIWLVLESAWRHANIDELTQLPGRRALKFRLDRLGRHYGLAMLDIDHFKKINDRYGHDTGDQVLRYVASQMRKSGAGHVYRYGGEEFVIVSSRADRVEFTDALEDLREAIAARPFWIRGLDRPKRKTGASRAAKRGGSESISVTVSIGAALKGDKYGSPAEVLEAADKSLYRAKRGGRNRVTLAR